MRTINQMESAIKVIADPKLKGENFVINNHHPLSIETINRCYLRMAKRHGMIEASAMHSAIHMTQLKDTIPTLLYQHDNTVNKFICTYKKQVPVGLESKLDQNFLWTQLCK